MAKLKTLARLLGYFSTFFSFLTLLKSPPGVPGALMWFPMLLADAWASVIALAGSLGALLGLKMRDRTAIWTGFLGAALAVRHIYRIILPHGNLAQAFGSNWHKRLSPDVRAHLSSSRFRLVQPSVQGVSVRRDVQIGVETDKAPPLLCDVWLPPIHIPRSGLAVLNFHGSLWQAADKGMFNQFLFRRLAGQGHVVFDVAYSLAPTADLKRILADVGRSITWAKTHAGEHGIDPARLVLMGQAGGGHLALLAAYAPHLPDFQTTASAQNLSVHAVISVYGITDMEAFWREYGHTNPLQPEVSSEIRDNLRPRLHDATWLDRLITKSRIFPAYRHANMPGGPLLLVYLMGGTLSEVPQAYHLASPLAHVGPHCPPTLQIFDQYDFVIDASHGRRLHAALRKAGVPSVYIEYPETVHAFDLYLGVSQRVSPSAQAAANDIETFLALAV